MAIPPNGSPSPSLPKAASDAQTIPMDSLKSLCPNEKALHCHSFSDSRTIGLKFSNTAVIIQSFSCSRGWLFLFSDIKHVFLLNPLTNIQIQPPLVYYEELSASPLDPNCIAIILAPSFTVGHLGRVGQNQSTWNSISCSANTVCNSHHNWRRKRVFHCNGKFYYVTSGLSVIDPASANPSNKTLKIDCSEMGAGLKFHYLLQFRGELMNVFVIYDAKLLDAEFQVYRADFCGIKWRRIYNIVDFVLCISRRRTVCLSASDVGCKGSSVYYMNANEPGRVIDWVRSKWIDSLCSLWWVAFTFTGLCRSCVYQRLTCMLAFFGS